MDDPPDRDTSTWSAFDPHRLADRLEAVPPSLGMEGKRAIVVEVVDKFLAQTKRIDEQEADRGGAL